MDFPSQAVSPLTITTWGQEGVLPVMTVSSFGSNLTWVSNQAVYMPIVLREPYLVQRVFWVNGSNLSNADFGIYTADGRRLYSTGSVAQSGAQAPQAVTPGDPFVLVAGNYYFAWASSGTTSRGFGLGTGSVGRFRMAGVLQQASALPLPAVMAPAALSTMLYPICGVTRTTSGF